jgi:Poly(hydroxyalcanoate) granule associated protein (phasin)
MKGIGSSVIMNLMEQRPDRLPHTRSRSLHRIWLAGLGALAKAQQEGGGELFLELVERGEEIEAHPGVEAPDLLSAEDRPAQLDLAEASRLVLACVQIIGSLDHQRRDTERLIEAMLPESPVPTPSAVLQARRNAAAREELIAEFGLLSSGEVAARVGSRAKNKAALANRWKQEGKIFSVSHQGLVFFPAFQFDDDGQPLPVIASILATVGRQSTGWELALWFMAANGWLDGGRPVDVLRKEPEAAAQAAEREAEGLFF